MKFSHLSRDADVKFYTGLKIREIFKIVFDYLFKKASDMHHWKVMANTFKDFSFRRDKSKASMISLEMEQELLLSLMRIRTGVSGKGLAFGF